MVAIEEIHGTEQKRMIVSGMSAEQMVKILRRLEPSSEIRRMLAILGSAPTAEELAEVFELMQRKGMIR